MEIRENLAAHISNGIDVITCLKSKRDGGFHGTYEEEKGEL